MMNMSRATLAGVFALGLIGAAHAQSPSVPMLGDSNPANPVATDGTPLPRNNTVGGHELFSGRSAFVDPVGGVVGAGVNTAGAVVGTGLGIANSAVDAGGQVITGGVNAAGQIVR